MAERIPDGKLTLQHKPYVIEVNDDGETIEIDTMDLEFPLKFAKCYEKIRKIEKEAETQRDLIAKKTDKKKDGALFSSNEIETFRMMNGKYDEMRGALDTLFGEGASMKIFGKRNWTTMFHEFFDAISPHLIKCGQSDEQLYAAIEAKYADAESNEL